MAWAVVGNIKGPAGADGQDGGGGVAGAAQVFVQQDDPETTNPSYTGPAVWYVLNSGGEIIGKRVRG